MASKVGNAMSLIDGFGFALHDYVRGGRNSPCLTLSLETQAQAAAAHKLVGRVFAKAKSATTPRR